jgi:hypothetical protein
MPLCLSFKYIDQKTNQDINDREFMDSVAPAANYLVDQISELCLKMELDPPRDLKEKMYKFQGRVVLNVSINFAGCSGCIKSTEDNQQHQGIYEGRKHG